VDAVVLGAARTYDDDRRPDAFGARALDDVPPVAPGEHEVEHTDVRPLEPELRHALVALPDHDGLEPAGREVPGHALGDDVVVLDDQDSRHRCVP
jgi:hypothetical protein